MKELDNILDKHLPDAGLCQRGKSLNRARKERMKADLLLLLAKDKDAMVLVDEQLLGITPMMAAPPKPILPFTDTTIFERHQ